MASNCGIKLNKRWFSASLLNANRIDLMENVQFLVFSRVREVFPNIIKQQNFKLKVLNDF